MKQMRTVIKEIARNRLFLETLESRDSDILDFHSLPVWQIKEALTEAYEAGQQAIIDSREGE